MAREEASRCRDSEQAEIAGDLALAYSSLAHRAVTIAEGLPPIAEEKP